MKISILLPTRKRAKQAIKSIESLAENMSENNELEILLAVDPDDEESGDKIVEASPLPCRLFVFEKRHGYENLYKYINFLCEQSTGEWLVLWNDDVLMETKNWDKVVQKYCGKFLFLNPKSNHPIPADETLFPIVPRKYFELLGHFSLNCSNDTWVQEIGRSLGIIKQINVTVLHDRADMTGNNEDETYKERVYRHDLFWGPEDTKKRNQDLDKIRSYING